MWCVNFHPHKNIYKVNLWNILHCLHPVFFLLAGFLVHRQQNCKWLERHDISHAHLHACDTKHRKQGRALQNIVSKAPLMVHRVTLMSAVLWNHIYYMLFSKLSIVFVLTVNCVWAEIESVLPLNCIPQMCSINTFWLMCLVCCVLSYL